MLKPLAVLIGQVGVSIRPMDRAGRVVGDPCTSDLVTLPRASHSEEIISQPADIVQVAGHLM